MCVCVLTILPPLRRSLPWQIYTDANIVRTIFRAIACTRAACAVSCDTGRNTHISCKILSSHAARSRHTILSSDKGEFCLEFVFNLLKNQYGAVFLCPLCVSSVALRFDVSRTSPIRYSFSVSLCNCQQRA